jgi:hypothetical protein
MPAGIGGVSVTPGVGIAAAPCAQPLSTTAVVSKTASFFITGCLFFARALITGCLFFARALITGCLFFARALITGCLFFARALITGTR